MPGLWGERQPETLGYDTVVLVQWSLAYGAGGFAVLQLLDAVGEPFGLSTFAQRAVITLVVLGFPIALVLAWYHGERGRQRVSAPELSIIALLLFISGAAIWALTPALPSPERAVSVGAYSGESRPFIAVLPLVNLSGREEDAWFTDGMHGQILTQLSRIPSLGVISGTSVQEYRSTSKNLRTIGQELGVQYIAEGDVLRAGNQVRVNIQLINAQSDAHVWANSYDRPLSVEK